jgi:hypothetical protein
MNLRDREPREKTCGSIRKGIPEENPKEPIQLEGYIERSCEWILDLRVKWVCTKKVS